MKNYKIGMILLCLFMMSCHKDDPCKDISCVNGGNCVNGDCLCPDQWTGPDCSQEKVPTKMRVGSIKITSFPPTEQNGSGWDLLDGADVYLVISKDNVALFSTGYVENLTTSYEWTVNFEFSDPTATYSISAYDYDYGLTGDDFMGGINFTPYQKGEKFPSSFTLACGNCVVSFDLKDVTYFHF